MQLNIPRYFTAGIISRAISPQFMVAAQQYHQGPHSLPSGRVTESR